MKLCLLFRTWAGLWLGEEHRLPGWVNRHVGGCADCAARLAREQQLTSQLRASSERERSVAPPFLAARVRAQLEVGVNPSAAPILKWTRLKPAASAAVALALLLAGMLLIRNQPRNQPRASVVTQGTERTDLLAEFKPAGTDWASWGEAAERSYEKELQLAMEDGRRVLTSLIQHFAPGAAADAWLSPGQTDNSRK